VAALKGFATWLRHHGITNYSRRTLENLWRLSAKVDKNLRYELSDYGVSLSLYFECCDQLRVLRQLVSCIDEENRHEAWPKPPRAWAKLMTSYRGQQVSLPAKIKTQGRVTVEDARLALGRATVRSCQKPATPGSTQDEPPAAEPVADPGSPGEDAPIDDAAVAITAAAADSSEPVDDEARPDELDRDSEQITDDPDDTGPAPRPLYLATSANALRAAQTAVEGIVEAVEAFGDVIWEGEPGESVRRKMAADAHAVHAKLDEILLVLEPKRVAGEAVSW
jgi:hypothetical protein